MCLPVLMMFSLVSCLKEKSVDSTDGGGAGILRMKIDGKQWTANKTAVASIMNGFISIMGSSADNIDLLITVNTTSAGVYQLDQASPHVAILLDNNETSPVGYTTNQGANSSVAGGTVTITKIDEATKRISGTFSVKVYRSTDDKSLMLTEGYFENLPYTAGPPPTGTGNSLSLKDDGNLWTAPLVAGTKTNGSINIIATDNPPVPARSITITVPETIQKGIYQFNAASLYVGVFIKNGNVFQSVDGGNLEITENISNTIKGIFSFTSKDASGTTGPTITEGSFSVTY